MSKNTNLRKITNYLTADNNTLSSNVSQTITGSLTVTGNLTAQQFILSSSVTYLTESFASGSHKFGDSSDDIHTFTGSLVVSGSANPLRVGSNLLFVSSSGNVGIGTTSPGQLLEVVGGEIKAGRVDSTNEGGQVSFGRSTDNNTAWYIDAYGNVASPQLRFVNVSNSLVAMAITGSYVGIGTSNPTNPLHVETTGADLGIQIYRNVASDGGSAPLFLSHKNTAGTINTVNVEALGAGHMVFRTGATGLATFGTERLRITSDGTIKHTLANENAAIYHNGAYQIANGGTKTINVTNNGLIFISENNTGDGALFHACYLSSTVTLISNPSGRYANTDTANKICFFKSAFSGTGTLKNNSGSQFSFTTFLISNSD